MEMLIFVISVLLLLVIYILIHAENKRFRVTEYTIESDKLDNNLTIAVLADLHDYEYGHRNVDVMECLHKINPDVVVSAGDMIEARKDSRNIYRTVEFLRELVKNFKFVYGMGNHECKLVNKIHKYRLTADVYEQALADSVKELERICPGKYEDILPLDNAIKAFEEFNIKIYGLNLENEYFKKVVINRTDALHISELVGKKDDSTFNILIGHNPDQFDAYCEWGADLVLSGHIHGGMINTPWGRGIISPRYMLFPKYDHGRFEKEKTTMILSRGLGNHTIHVRIFNRAEIVVVRLLSKKTV